MILYVMVWFCVGCGYTEPVAPLLSGGLDECRAVAIQWVKDNGGTFLCARVPKSGFVWTNKSTQHEYDGS